MIASRNFLIPLKPPSCSHVMSLIFSTIIPKIKSLSPSLLFTSTVKILSSSGEKQHNNLDMDQLFSLVLKYLCASPWIKVLFYRKSDSVQCLVDERSVVDKSVGV